MSDGLRADPQEGTEQVARSAETAETRADADLVDCYCDYVFANIDTSQARVCAGCEWYVARTLLRYIADYNLTGTEQTLHIDWQGMARAFFARLDGTSSAHPSPGAVLVGDRQGQAGSGDDGNRRPGGGEPT